MAPAGCHTHRHASRETLQNMIIAYIIHITSWAIPYHRKHSLQKQVRRLYFVVACFTWLLWVSSKNVSYLRMNHNVICQLLFTLHKDPFHQIRSD